ncbi:MAG TPA: hypothetical protein VH592_22515 [Gemmataceae bacterium]|jgi:hypothetical protein
MSAAESPNVVEGTVIRTALGTVMLCAAGSGLLALASGFVLWDTWTHKDGEYLLPFHLAKDSLFTSFAVILCLIGGAGGLIAFCFQALFPHRLIFGNEVLQVIRTGIFGPTVTAQIPYANIASVTCEREEYGFKQLRVGIDIQRADAPGTYARRQDFRKKNKNERDLYLPGFLAASAEEIAKQIADRCRRSTFSADG